ncbi:MULTISPECIES: hypothetical protein [unclassified Clostridium]|uniref:hypothetical protein n=1 Tax=unclassified Clostridium TaxID=2614128 RepID=UPI0025BD56EE|nr:MULTISPECIES: hypothetical protein [unclassified Clostridium]
MEGIIKKETMFDKVKQKLKDQGSRISQCYQFDIGNDGYIKMGDDEKIEYSFKDKTFIIENDEEAYQIISGKRHKVMPPMLLTSILYILDGHFDAANMLNNIDITITDHDSRIEKANKIILMPFIFVVTIYGILPFVVAKFNLSAGITTCITLIIGLMCLKGALSIMKK